jgi:hypothetical protein
MRRRSLCDEESAGTRDRRAAVDASMRRRSLCDGAGGEEQIVAMIIRRRFDAASIAL